MTANIKYFFLSQCFTFIVLLFHCLSGCNDIDYCESNDSRKEIVIHFIDLATGISKEVDYSVIAEGSSLNYQFQMDTTFTETGDTLITQSGDAISLPLNPSSDTVTYYFLSDVLDDTLIVSYQRKFFIFDTQCAAYIAFTHLDTVFHSFDSLSIIGTAANRNFPVNINIYLRTDSL